MVSTQVESQVESQVEIQVEIQVQVVAVEVQELVLGKKSEYLYPQIIYVEVHPVN
jgi:hypothetical protein